MYGGMSSSFDRPGTRSAGTFICRFSLASRIRMNSACTVMSSLAATARIDTPGFALT